jgi:hypothetical protein
MSRKNILLILACLLWFIGFLLIILQNWQIGLGVFLLLWANNIEWRLKATTTNDNSQHDK